MFVIIQKKNLLMKFLNEIRELRFELFIYLKVFLFTKILVRRIKLIWILFEVNIDFYGMKKKMDRKKHGK
jgi:hypothetical protein